ncbi:uncharacterized protein EAF02_012142 [Botrytis sinoallii]|uniref:uncharacterized protein n=1 Tax=Botrytis sinoallii TaxID=1463999 RepID=UPI001900BED5|nr:uncharacterized protein EAF02_012142 [Botrytis sinoallii]KAF7852743.1 hypothetical protein EAF02_012142 [Botrytis sinoallii]
MSSKKGKTNGNIRQFFKPTQQAATSASTPLSTTSRNNDQITSGSSLSTNPQPTGLVSSATMEPMSSPQSSSSPSSPQSTSSLSTPPVNIPQSSSNISNGVVPCSDDEGDSDSSLEDLNVIFKTNRTAPIATSSTLAPVSPRASRFRNDPFSSAKRSPLALRTTPYKFDLKHLMGTAVADRALEEKERRLKEIAQEDTEMGDDEPTAFNDDIHGGILRKLNEEKEDGGGKDIQKVLKAVKRTEAGNVGSRWYFFEMGETPPIKRKPFPTSSLPKNWKNDLAEPQIRHQTFVSGFAENMIAYRKKLPDEIIQWILDDFCLEEQNDLRNAYSSVLAISRKQVHRLVTPVVIRKMFKSIGATNTAIALSEKVVPRLEISDAYSNHPWSKVRALIGLLNLTAKYLQQETRLEVICILLRLGIDRALLERVDLLSQVQTTLHNLCLWIDPDVWEESSQTICATLFNTVELASFRLDIVNSIPPIRSSKLHELRRRLALTFFFSSLPVSLSPPQKSLSIRSIIQRLNDPPFQITRTTDYPELSALILLLDIGIDDGRAEDLDLTDEDTEIQFNKDVDELTDRFANFGIMASGAAHISKVETSGILNLVERRIEHTVRTRRKPKNMFYEETKKYYEQGESLEGMQKGMSNFVKQAK